MLSAAPQAGFAVLAARLFVQSFATTYPFASPAPAARRLSPAPASHRLPPAPALVTPSVTINAWLLVVVVNR
jgi:hypothetical protein